MSNDFEKTTASLAPDPFDESNRKSLLRRLQTAFVMRTHAIVREIDQDIRDRGVAEQTMHPRIKELFEAVGHVADEILDFDTRAAELRVLRASTFGLRAENPFNLEHEQCLVELVRKKISSAAWPLGQSHRLRVGKVVRAASPEEFAKLMSNTQSSLGGMAHAVAERICSRLQREYAERRAHFEVNLAQALAGRRNLDQETPQGVGLNVNETTFSVTFKGAGPVTVGNKKEFHFLATLAKSLNGFVTQARLAESLGGDELDKVAHVKSRLVKLLRENGLGDLADCIKTQKGHYGLFLL